MRIFCCWDCLCLTRILLPGCFILLSLSNRNEVDVPEDLKRKLEESVQYHAERQATHTEFLVEKQEERRSWVVEDETAKLLIELTKKLKSKPPYFSLRVKDGSYTVTNYYEDSSSSAKDSGGEQPDGPRRAKQKIATVKTESPIYKLCNLLFKCMTGDLKRRTEEVVVMDQVNLAFEPSKMYLVLYVYFAKRSVCLLSLGGYRPVLFPATPLTNN